MYKDILNVDLPIYYSVETSFSQKGRTGKNEVKRTNKREFGRVRAIAMEGSFAPHKEH